MAGRGWGPRLLGIVWLLYWLGCCCWEEIVLIGGDGLCSSSDWPPPLPWLKLRARATPPGGGGGGFADGCLGFALAGGGGGGAAAGLFGAPGGGGGGPIFLIGPDVEDGLALGVKDGVEFWKLKENINKIF